MKNSKSKMGKKYAQIHERKVAANLGGVNLGGEEGKGKKFLSRT